MNAKRKADTNDEGETAAAPAAAEVAAAEAKAKETLHDIVHEIEGEIGSLLSMPKETLEWLQARFKDLKAKLPEAPK